MHNAPRGNPLGVICLRVAVVKMLTAVSDSYWSDRKHRALKFVLLIGVVSFFADFTYEGARSITGPYLAILGASATIVGYVVQMSCVPLLALAGNWPVD